MNGLIEVKKEKCSACGASTEIIYLNSKKKNELCFKCSSETEEKEREQLIKGEKKERLDIYRALTHINVNYTGDILLPSQNQTVIKIQNDIKLNLKNFKKGTYLFGTSGSGKTTNLQIFAHYLLYTPKTDKSFRDYDEFLFMTESNFVSKIFSLAKDDFSWNFQLAINSYLKGKRFIFLDELGAIAMNEKEIQIMDLTFHYFEENRSGLRLFASSNKSLEDLENYYSSENASNASDRILSRLYHLVVPKKMEDSDYRKIKKI